MDIVRFNEAVQRKAQFTHVEKGHTYIVREILISKHPQTGEWYDAVFYEQLETGKFFVRSVQSFLDNFELNF